MGIQNSQYWKKNEKKNMLIITNSMFCFVSVHSDRSTALKACWFSCRTSRCNNTHACCRAPAQSRWAGTGSWFAGCDRGSRCPDRLNAAFEAPASSEDREEQRPPSQPKKQQIHSDNWQQLTWWQPWNSWLSGLSMDGQKLFKIPSFVFWRWVWINIVNTFEWTNPYIYAVSQSLQKRKNIN